MEVWLCFGVHVYARMYVGCMCLRVPVSVSAFCARKGSVNKRKLEITTSCQHLCVLVAGEFHGAASCFSPSE